MRRMRAGLLLAALGGLVAGCCAIQPPQTSTSWLDRLRQFGGPQGSDVVYMDVAVVERPPGDPYLNDELWKNVDEQVVPEENRRLIDENGFRICQIGGLLPLGLQDLIGGGRTASEPRHIQTRAGTTTTLPMGPPQAQCQFQVLALDGPPTPYHLEQAQFALAVTPTPTGDGRVKLQFVPQVQHSDAKARPTVLGGNLGWPLQAQRPIERFPALGWEVTLAANDYVVVGTCVQRLRTLGQQCFVSLLPDPAAQRLLLLRAGVTGLPPAPAGEAPASATLPLAYQAVLGGTARGSSR